MGGGFSPLSLPPPFLFSHSNFDSLSSALLTDRQKKKLSSGLPSLDSSDSKNVFRISGSREVDYSARSFFGGSFFDRESLMEQIREFKGDNNPREGAVP